MKQKNSDGDLKSFFTPWKSAQTDPEETAPKKMNPEAFTIENIVKFDLVDYLKTSTKFYMENKIALKKELLSGITVAVMQVPESVAFSFVAGVDPIVGLYSTFFLGLITALIGGKPGMISGAAGAMAVVIKDLMLENGPLKDFSKGQRFEHLLMCVLLTGLLQVACGFFQLAQLVTLIPEPAMIGFMNGLGTVIFMAQFGAFTECNHADAADKPNSPDFADCTSDELDWLPITAGRTWLTLWLVALTMVIMYFQPQLEKCEGIVGIVAGSVPSSLVSIVLGTVIEHTLHRKAFNIHTRTVGETAGIDGAPPSWHFPEVPSDGNWGVIIQYAISLCLVGLIESVMTLQACDMITETEPSTFRSNMECVAQGVANALCGVFGAMGGDAMIGQSTINIMNGARGRVSGATAGIVMLIFIVAASPVIELVPIGTLTGVLFMVVINTFNWSTFTTLYYRKVNKYDAFVIVEVSVLAVVTNLAIGVIVGVMTISTFDAWRRGTEFDMETRSGVCVDGNAPVKVYKPTSPLLFSCTKQFGSFFTPGSDPALVVVDLEASGLVDLSAVLAVVGAAKRYAEKEKRLVLTNVSPADQAAVAQAQDLGKGVEYLEASKLRTDDNLIPDQETGSSEVELPLMTIAA